MRIQYFFPGRRATCLLSVMALLLAVGLTTACSKKGKLPMRMVVTYAGQGSQWERAGKTLPLKRGLALGPNDVVITGNAGVVDLQSPSGSSIRVQKFSRVRISELSEKTSLELKQGTLLAKVQRRDASQEFEVRTPTLVAGVRGTSFRVEESGVKVISGKVAVRPRVRAIEGKSKQEIEANATLKSLARQVSRQEKILTPGQRAELPEEKAKALQALNGSPASADAALPDTKLLVVKEEGIDLRDKADAATLVQVDEKVLSELAMADPADAKNKDPNWLEPRVKSLAKDYEQKRDAALDAFETENVQKGAPATEEALRKEYEVVEYVHLLHSKEVYVGAVLTQAGGILVIQTKDGFKRVPLAEVNYIDYK